MSRDAFHAHPKLGRFDPLDRILFVDDFDTGLNGWTRAIGNYEGSLDTMLKPYQAWRPPMLSNLTVWDTGTTGALDGNYALKLSTLPQAGALSQAMKRLTWRAAGPVRFEYYFTFKPEPSELKLSDKDVRFIGFAFDLQQSDRNGNPHRVLPHVRYLNALNGERQGRWQFKSRVERFHDIGASNETVSFYHLGPEGWQDIPGGEQRLCYNEIPTKLNWHYFSIDFDLDTMSYISMRCNDRFFDMSQAEPMKLPAMPNLWCMFQPFVFIETDTDKRAFLYLDSAVLSAKSL